MKTIRKWRLSDAGDLEKAGFAHEGSLLKHAEKNGTIIDVEMYALIKEEGLDLG